MVARWPTVTTGPVGNKIAALIDLYPQAAELWISSGTDGDHGTSSHHYGLTYNGSPTAALDVVGNPSTGGLDAESQRRMRDFAKWCYDNFPDLIVELIHTTPYPDDDGFYIQNGTKYPGGGPYGNPGDPGSTAGQHNNHVHLAMSDATVTEAIARMSPQAPPPPQPAPSTPDDELWICDIASWQVRQVPAGDHPLDLVAAQQAGIRGVNIKLSQGNWYTWSDRTMDPTREDARYYADWARSLGMAVSTFHWIDDSASGAEQAQLAFRRMAELGGPDGMAHAVDCEDTKRPASLATVREYIETMQALLGRPIFLYTGDWWWQPRGYDVSDLTPYAWAAPNDGYLDDYPGDDSPAWAAGYGGWPELAALQFAVRPIRSAPAGGGNVSLTVVRDKAVWAAVTTKAATPPPSDPPPAQEPPADPAPPTDPPPAPSVDLGPVLAAIAADGEATRAALAAVVQADTERLARVAEALKIG